MAQRAVQITQRFYVANEGALATLGQVVDNTLLARQKVPGDWRLKILVGSPGNLPETVAQDAAKTLGRAVAHDMDIDFNRGYGVGNAWFDAQFNYAGPLTAFRKPPIKILTDAEQFNVGSSEYVNSVSFLVEEMPKRGLLYGVAQRDAVSLSPDPQLDAMRQVEELFHLGSVPEANAVKWENPFGVDMSKVPVPYQEAWDFIPGTYAFDVGHERFPEFQATSLAAAQSADLTRFGGDPYVMMKAGQLSQGMAVATPIVDNPPVRPFKKETFTLKAKELAKTDVGLAYAASTRDADRTEYLRKHYGATVVDETQRMILSGLPEEPNPHAW